ncbi:MAG: hypothetical protein ACI39H_08265 [Lachnospiraceae bacterium]
MYSNRIEKADMLAESVIIRQGEYLNDSSQSENLFDERSSFIGENVRQQNETSYDFAQKYNPDARYDLKGSESDLASLDYINEVPQAYKDEVLKQYQIFVGSKPAEQAQPETQSAGRMMENFML